MSIFVKFYLYNIAFLPLLLTLKPGHYVLLFPHFENPVLLEIVNLSMVFCLYQLDCYDKMRNSKHALPPESYSTTTTPPLTIIHSVIDLYIVYLNVSSVTDMLRDKPLTARIPNFGCLRTPDSQTLT